MHFVQLARSGHVTVPAHQQMHHTSSLTSSLLPPPPPPPHTTSPPLPLPTRRVSARTCHTMPQEPQNSTKTTPPTAARRHETRRAWRIKNVMDMTEHMRGARRGQRGTGKQQAGCTRYARLFFLFFHVYWHPPSLLAPPPPSPPANHEEHTYKGVFFVVGKFSTPPPLWNPKNASKMAHSLGFVFRRHPHPIPSSQTMKNTPLWVCSSCLGSSPPSTNTKHEKHAILGVFFVFRVSAPSPSNQTHETRRVWACFMCLVAHLLLPTSEHKMARFSCSAPTLSPPPTFKHQKHACLGTFSVFDHLQPLSLYSISLPSLLTPSLLFPTLPLPFFSFLGPFYLGNYHFRHFPFK